MVFSTIPSAEAIPEYPLRSPMFRAIRAKRPVRVIHELALGMVARSDLEPRDLVKPSST